MLARLNAATVAASRSASSRIDGAYVNQTGSVSFT